MLMFVTPPSRSGLRNAAAGIVVGGTTGAAVGGGIAEW